MIKSKSTQLIQIEQKDLKDFRKKQWLKQNKICPVLNQKIPFEESVVDHKHKTKNEIIGKKGKGLIRGVIHRQGNVVEGKITNMYKRYGVHKFIDLPSFLRNLANYLENPPIPLKYIHPSEKIKKKKKKLTEMDYNRVKKYWNFMYPKRKLPKKPLSGKQTKEWKEYIEQAKKEHYKYTGIELK